MDTSKGFEGVLENVICMAPFLLLVIPYLSTIFFSNWRRHVNFLSPPRFDGSGDGVLLDVADGISAALTVHLDVLLIVILATTACNC